MAEAYAAAVDDEQARGNRSAKRLGPLELVDVSRPPQGLCSHHLLCEQDEEATDLLARSAVSEIGAVQPAGEQHRRKQVVEAPAAFRDSDEQLERERPANRLPKR